MIRTVLAAAVARSALADLHALAPSTREEHRPAVKRSAERAAKASRLLADHGHLLPPALRQKGQDLLNEHEFRLHVALDSANPGLALAAIEKKESGYLKAFAKLGGDNAVSKARKLPKDDERTKFRATRDVLLAATGVDAEEPVWGAPFRARSAVRRGPRAHGGARRFGQVLRRWKVSDEAVPRRTFSAMRLLDVWARGCC